jgi:hypothetical protein
MILFFFFIVMLGIEPSALHILGKGSTAEVHPLPSP